MRFLESRLRRLAYCNRGFNRWLMKIKKSLDEVEAILSGDCKRRRR